MTLLHSPLSKLSTLDFDLDYSSWSTRVSLITTGFLVYLGIFIMCHLVSLRLSATYKSLSAREKVFWNLAATRAVFGVQCIITGLTALLFDPKLVADPITAQRGWSWFTILIATGFFVFENLALHLSNFVFRTFDAFLAVHHIFAFLNFFGIVFYNTVGHYLPMVSLLLEISTPFTCLSWMLLKADQSHTFFWKANQWVMVHLFHCRMVLMYHVWWVSVCNWDHIVRVVPLAYLAVYFSGLVTVTLILNPYWTYKKTQQLQTPVDWNFQPPSTESMVNNGGFGIKKTN